MKIEPLPEHEYRESEFRNKINELIEAFNEHYHESFDEFCNTGLPKVDNVLKEHE